MWPGEQCALPWVPWRCPRLVSWTLGQAVCSSPQGLSRLSVAQRCLHPLSVGST